MRSMEQKTTLCFNARGNDGSGLSGTGMKLREWKLIKVPVIPIDAAIEADDRAAMTKMNEKGAELEACGYAAVGLVRKTGDREKVA